MTRPLVSVCLLTFNHRNYIHDCLMSALAQADDVALEILVGDDRSEDGTSAIVEAVAGRYPDIVKHCLRATRLGSAENYQALLRQASGTYIATLDGDDFWLPGKLRAQVRFLEANRDCAAVYANAVVVDDGRKFLGLFNNRLQTKFDLAGMLRRGNFLHNSSVVFRAVERDALLGFEAPYLDYKAHLHFALRGGIGYLNQALSGYRVASKTSMVVNANDQVRDLYWKALLEVPRDQVRPDALAQGMADFLRRVLFRAVRVRRPGLAMQWSARVLGNSPVSRPRMLWMTACNVVRVALQELTGWLGARLSGAGLRVFYRR